MEQNNPNYSNQSQSGNFGQGQPYQGQQQQNQNQGNYQFPHQGAKLPADPLSITLGIISLVLFFVGCWCYGLIAIITLIISIIGLVTANRSLKLYNSDPNNYSQSSEKSVSTGRVINIVGVVLSGIVCFVLLIGLLFFGAALASAMDEGLNFDDLDNNNSIYSDDYDDSSDVEEEDWYYYEEEVDSLEQESDNVIEVEEIIKD